MRLFVNLPLPLAVAVVASAERNHRRPADELLALAEAEMQRAGLVQPSHPSDVRDTSGAADPAAPIRCPGGVHGEARGD